MSNDTTEELLRAGMARFTADTTAPPRGLAVRAIRHRRRTGVAKAAGTVGTVATAAGIITAVAMSGAGPVPAATPSAQTAAYVVSHTLVASSSANLVESSRVTTSGGLRVSVMSSGIIPIIGYGDSQQGSSHLAEWSRGLQAAKVVSYGADGQTDSVFGWATTARHTTTTSVDYQHKTWSRLSTPPARPLSGLPGCDAARGADGSFLGLSDGDAAATLRTALRCGQFTLAGTSRVDGIEALELKPVPSAAGFDSVTIWVDPSSYLPVRSVATLTRLRGTVRVDYQWLKPTKANVAELDVMIPAGFTKVPAP